MLKRDQIRVKGRGDDRKHLARLNLGEQRIQQFTVPNGWVKNAQTLAFGGDVGGVANLSCHKDSQCARRVVRPLLLALLCGQVLHEFVLVSNFGICYL